MQPEDPQTPYLPPRLRLQAPGKSKSGLMIAAVVAGTVTVTLCGAAAAVFSIVRGSGRLPPVTYSEVWLDNRSAERLSVEVDGKVEATVEPLGFDGAVGVLRVADGRRAVRVLGAGGAVKDARTLELAGARVIYPVGGEAQYAMVTVHYARPETSVVADSARSLPRNADGTSWQLPLSVPVHGGIDQPFPDRNPEPERRHVCRVVARNVQCEGGPKALTSSETFPGVGARE